jgi:hypothetical protein
VILYGSHARGEATATSDYDLLGIRESGEVFRDARPWQGTYLDVFVYPESRVAQPDESMLHILGGKVLFEKDGIGTRFLVRLAEIHAAGPRKLAPDEVRARKVWASKMLDRARVGDTEGRFRRAWLLTAVLEDFFLVQGKWYRGPKESLAWLKINNPDLFAKFDAALRPDAPISDIESLVQAATAHYPAS